VYAREAGLGKLFGVFEACNVMVCQKSQIRVIWVVDVKLIQR